jgi:hypothetical protein
MPRLSYSAGPRRSLRSLSLTQRNRIMSRIIWLVGAVVIIIAIAGFLGLR